MSTRTTINNNTVNDSRDALTTTTTAVPPTKEVIDLIDDGEDSDSTDEVEIIEFTTRDSIAFSHNSRIIVNIPKKLVSFISSVNSLVKQLEPDFIPPADSTHSEIRCFECNTFCYGVSGLVWEDPFVFLNVLRLQDLTYKRTCMCIANTFVL